MLLPVLALVLLAAVEGAAAAPAPQQVLHLPAQLAVLPVPLAAVAVAAAAAAAAALAAALAGPAAAVIRHGAGGAAAAPLCRRGVM